MLRLGLLLGLVFAGCGLWRDCISAESTIPPFCRAEGYFAKLQLPEKRHSEVSDDFACVVSLDAGVVTFSVTGEGCFDNNADLMTDTPIAFEAPCVIPDGEWVVSTSRGSQRIRVVDGGVDCAP